MSGVPIQQRAKTIGEWLLAALLDAGYLVVWVAIQWGVAYIVEAMPLYGVKAQALVVAQYLFAFATIIPILVFIVVDVLIMIAQAKKAVRLARKDREHSWGLESGGGEVRHENVDA